MFFELFLVDMLKRTVPGKNVKQERSGASRPALWRVMEIHKIVRADRYPNCQTLAREIEERGLELERRLHGLMRERAAEVVR